MTQLICPKLKSLKKNMGLLRDLTTCMDITYKTTLTAMNFQLIYTVQYVNMFINIITEMLLTKVLKFLTHPSMHESLSQRPWPNSDSYRRKVISI